MSKRLFCSDVEADNLLAMITKLWCCSFTELSPTMEEKGSLTLTTYKDIAEFFSNPDHIIVMHNGIGYDKPAVEKVLGIEVKAEIIDTLYMSWYLYPKQRLHGLEFWGELLGIAKPKVDDWENLKLEDYIHRCQEDVRIQVALWKQMWKHLMLIWSNDTVQLTGMSPVEGAWHTIRHLNFKAHCAALQENAKWKLDVERAEELRDEFEAKYQEAKDALEARMPKVPIKDKKSRPKKPYKANQELSATGLRWKKLVEEHVDPELYFHGDPMDYMDDIEFIKGYKEPNAGSSIQLKNWLDACGWVPESFKHDRNKETGKVRKIPQLKNQETEELCESIVRLIQYEPALEYLREMSVVKHRLGVVKGFLTNVDDDGFVYAAVQGLTNTLRFKHKICVNLPSVRKPYGAEIRGLLTASSDETELCGSDMSSLEDRTKQHYMWEFDPEYVKEMMSPDFDPHLDMALAAGLLTKDDVKFYKTFNKETATDADHHRYSKLSKIRHAGKGCNYAATYGATGPTIARAAGVDEAMGEALYDAYWKRNWALTAIADARTVKMSRGMKWMWNPVAKMWYWLKTDKDRFSTLNQGTGTYAFDRWVFHILAKRPQLTAQFHDEVVLEINKGNQDACTKLLKGAIDTLNDELKLNRELGCDVDYGHSYAEIH